MDPNNADDDPVDEPQSDTAAPGTTRSPRRKRGWLFGALGIVVVAAVAATVFVFSGSGDSRNANAAGGDTPPTTSQLNVSLPTSTTSSESEQPPGSVRLPDGSTADLVKRGVEDDGTLPVPQDLEKAAWWGAELGESGAMLLSGHVNWDGEQGPFKELLQIDAGEQVSVHDDSGGEWHYQVDDVQKIDKEELPEKAPTLFKQSGDHRLVLVTCGGDFVGGSEGYDSNVIATAHLVSGPH